MLYYHKGVKKIELQEKEKYEKTHKKLDNKIKKRNRTVKLDTIIRYRKK